MHKFWSPYLYRNFRISTESPMGLTYSILFSPLNWRGQFSSFQVGLLVTFKVKFVADIFFFEWEFKMYFGIILQSPTYNSFQSDSFFLSPAITSLSYESGGAIIYFLDSSKTIQLSGFINF